jgi:PKD repeat protein
MVWRSPVAALGLAVLLPAAVPRCVSAECTLSCVASATSTVGVGQAVTFTATALPSGCAGSPGYDWDFGDGSPHATVRNPSHAYDSAGAYTWTVVLTLDGRTCTRSGTVTVCALECAATAPPAGRVGAPVAFTGSGTTTSCSTLSFDWDFGDGTSHSSKADPKHTYAAVGSYAWTLKARIQGTTLSCTATGTIDIAEAIACSECAADVPGATAVGAATPFRSFLGPADCSGPVTYAWAFGDATTSTSANPDHVYCAEGSYEWSVTVTMGGVACTASGTIAVGPATALECSATVVGSSGACPRPAVFIGSTAACAAQSVYSWSFGDGAAAVGRTVTHTYGARGAYTWTLTAALAGATSSRSGTVTVTAPTSVTALGTPSPTFGAPPLEVAFSGAAQPERCIEAATYAWDFGDGAASSEQNPSHTFAADGFYTWTLTVTTDGVAGTARGPVVVSARVPPYTWAPQLSGTTAPLVDTHFTGESEGWAVGQRALLHTIDGARSWAAPLNPWAYGVRFLDPSTGFFAAECGLSRTQDRGETWDGLYFSSCGGFTFTDVFPVSSAAAWLCDSSGGMWRFSFLGDGAFEVRRTFPAGTGSSNYRDLWFADADNGWAVGDAGRITRVSDASGTAPAFTAQISGTSARLSAIAMAGAEVGWAVGAGGTVVHTGDGGATWGPQATGTTIDIFAVDFQDATTGWAVGEGGLILGTPDGGTTWEVEPDPQAAALRGVSAPPGSFVYAVGSGGTVLKRLPFPCPAIAVWPDVLPDMAAGMRFSRQLTASGGSPPYTFGIATGALPEGLQLDGSGLLSGIPAGPSASGFTVRAVDAASCSGDRAYAVSVVGRRLHRHLRPPGS